MHWRHLYVPILTSVFAASCGGSIEDDEAAGEATATMSSMSDDILEDDEVVGEATATVNAPDKVLCYIKKERGLFRGRVRFYGAHRTADGWKKVSLGHVSCSLFTRHCKQKVENALREIVREGYVPVVDREGHDKCHHPFD